MFTLMCDSVRFIQRTLKAAGLSGNGRRDSIQDDKDAIKVSYIEEYYYCHYNCRLQGSGCLLGYRSMWNRLKRRHNHSVSRYIL